MSAKGNTKTIYQRLAAAQADCTAVGKDSKAHQYKYASLAAVLDMLRPVLAKHELALHHTISHHEALGMVAVAAVTDGAGEAVETVMPIPTPQTGGRMNPMQELGSILSYSRRYAILSLFNLATEDDDGVGAKDAEYKKPAFKKEVKTKVQKKQSAARDANNINSVLSMIEAAKTGEDLSKITKHIIEHVPEEQHQFVRPVFKKAQERIVKGSV